MSQETTHATSPKVFNFDSLPADQLAAQARATTDSPDAWSGDRPIYLTLAGWALATAATVPVMLAVWGPTPVFKLVYAAALMGGLIAFAGLLSTGCVVGGLRLLRAYRAGQPVKPAKPTGRLRGKLAFN